MYVPERVRASERAHHASRKRILRVVARHRSTGAVAGHKVEFVDTWNTASNDHMVGVNERLGYQVVGYGAEYQRRI